MSLTDKWIKQLDADFCDHKAQLLAFDNINGCDSDRIQKLIWKAPNTGIYAIQYLWDTQISCLFVSGDMYEGIYRWCGGFNLASVARTSLDYFASKCEASSAGTDGRGRRWYVEELVEFCEPNCYEDYKDLVDGLCGWFDCKPTELAKTLRSSWEGESQEGWVKLLNDLDADVVGDNDYFDLGVHISLYTVAHWYGLKCAWEQLNKTC
jgi:hypothetical protein